MDPLLQSLLSKIPQDLGSLKFELTSNLVTEKLIALTSRFPNLDFDRQYGLAVLFQHVSLELFTDPELLFVSNLNLHILDAVHIPSDPIEVINPITPLFDTGSGRLYQQIPYESIFQSSLHLISGSLSYYSSSSLPQLIFNLYSLSLSS